MLFLAGGGTPGSAKRNTLNKRMSLQKQSSLLSSQSSPVGKAGGAGSTNLPKIGGPVAGAGASAGGAGGAHTNAGPQSRFTGAALNPAMIYGVHGTTQPPSPSSRTSPGGASPGGAANATIVLRRPPSPSTNNTGLLSIGLAPSPSHSRRGSNGALGGLRSASPAHSRNVSGFGSGGLGFGSGGLNLGIPLPLEEGGHAPVTPRASSGAALNDAPFDTVDELVSGNAAYREVFRIVRLIAAQPSCDQMVLVLEKHTRALLRADAVRVLLVTRHGFTHPTLSQALSLDQGLASHCIHKRECVNLATPASDPRFHPDVDQVGERAPLFYACVPVEGDPQPSCSGPRDVVALVQLFKDKEGGMPFSPTDLRQVARLAEFTGNMLLRSRHADRAYALYNTSLSTQKRSAALLDVAKALSSETRLSDVVSVIVSQVPEMLVSSNTSSTERSYICRKGAAAGEGRWGAVRSACLPCRPRAR